MVLNKPLAALMILIFISLFYAIYLNGKADAQTGKSEIGLNSPTSFPVDI